jgi:hypothetical protein
MSAIYSPLHRLWIVLRADRPELIFASGRTKVDAEAAARAILAKQAQS